VSSDGLNAGFVSGGDDGSVVMWRPFDPSLDSRRLDVPTRLLSDATATEDQLGTSSVADALVRFLTHPQTAAPLSVAVKGPWGVGKSTLMNLVRDGLDPRDASGQRAPLQLAEEDGFHSRRARATGMFRRLRQLRAGKGLTAGAVFREAGRPDGNLPTGSHVSHRLTVWFNPWSYQSGEQVWAGLAHELIEQITGRLPRADREAFWLRLNLARVDRSSVRRVFYEAVLERAIKPGLALAAIAAVLLLAGLVEGAVALLTGGVAASVATTAVIQWARPATSIYQGLIGGSLYDRVRNAGDLLGGSKALVSEPGYGARSGYVHLIQTDIKRVIELAATPERPLVVFVDDLDRCNPGTVMQVLEAINLFLAGDLRDCIFVLGIEPSMLTAHIEADYSALIETLRGRDPRLHSEDLSWRFLQKLIQLSVRVPEPSEQDLAGFIDQLIRPPDERSAVSKSLDNAESLPAVDHEVGLGGLNAASVRNPRSESRSGRDDVPPSTVDRVEELLTFRDNRIRLLVAKRLSEITANPRKVKRIVNLFLFNSYVAAGRGLLPAEDEALITDLKKVLDLAELLTRWPEYAERFAERDSTGSTSLEKVADAAQSDDVDRWHNAVEETGLVRVVVSEAKSESGKTDLEGDSRVRETVEPQSFQDEVVIEDLRLFLRRSGGSVPLMAELI